ncbi:MAG: MaoC family dehydratase N-terminal domain-containing protein [Candidatus Rokubacteria bacterium]|nr:MaoC family dehydratase N-terminal domain-containing protein [Candidatus Rokubacteria bacterium]
MRFYDDLEVGHGFETRRKTITETAITLCVGLAGMTVPIFNDVESARATGAAGFIAPARTVLMMMGGLEEQAFEWEPATRLVGFRAVKFLRPVMAGDTIHVMMEIVEKRESRTGGRGIVVHRSTCLNQGGEAVVECEVVHLVAKQAAC